MVGRMDAQTSMSTGNCGSGKAVKRVGQCNKASGESMCHGVRSRHLEGFGWGAGRFPGAARMTFWILRGIFSTSFYDCQANLIPTSADIRIVCPTSPHRRRDGLFSIPTVKCDVGSVSWQTVQSKSADQSGLCRTLCNDRAKRNLNGIRAKGFI